MSCATLFFFFFFFWIHFCVPWSPELHVALALQCIYFEIILLEHEYVLNTVLLPWLCHHCVT